MLRLNMHSAIPLFLWSWYVKEQCSTISGEEKVIPSGMHSVEQICYVRKGSARRLPVLLNAIRVQDLRLMNVRCSDYLPVTACHSPQKRKLSLMPTTLL